MRRHRSALGLSSILVVALMGCDVLPQGSPAGDPAGRPLASLSVRDVLGGDASGFARALEAPTFEFPRDHGAHPEYRNEWWYFTGNLETDAGRAFGYQLTLFRTSLAPPSAATAGEAPRRSPWRTRQAWMGHLAVTDVDGERFFAFDRFARGAMGLAGAQAEPFRVWLEDWEIATDPTAAPGTSVFPITVDAREGDVGIRLTVEPEKPMVLQGDGGLSQKGATPGNASYYYSYSRLGTRGEVVIDGEALKVSGTSWLDREWSTSALEEDQVGWDWFALQLSDGRDLMFYLLRLDSGEWDPASGGVLVDPDGTARRLTSGDVSVEVLDRWESPKSGAVYPAKWRLVVEDEDIELEVSPRLAGQELNLAFRYWEGSVAVRGTAAGQVVEGLGYVELTGYRAS